MQNSPIIFCHYGFSNYLPYVFECVKISNPNKKIILLGDSANKAVAKKYGLLHYNLEQFEYGQDVETFKKNYQLIYTKGFDYIKHGKDWNEFVFKKWFGLYNFLEENKIEKFWHFDSDVMIFRDLTLFEPKLLNFDCTEQCHGICMKGYITNRNIVEKYIKKINEIFLRQDFMQDLKNDPVKHIVAGCFNEMNAYEIFKKEEKFKTFHLANNLNESIFDDLIYRGSGYKMEKLPTGDVMKIVHMNNDGRFFCVDEKNSQFVEVNALNLSWVPIYIFKAILKHFKKNIGKEKQDFNPNSETLKDIRIPLWTRFKRFRKNLKRKLKEKK